LCQITSNPYADARAIILTNSSFQRGSLHRTSYARPGKLFTANDRLIVGTVGSLTPDAFKQIVEAVVQLLRSSL
jgi:mRNA interferase MazF